MSTSFDLTLKVHREGNNNDDSAKMNVYNIMPIRFRYSVRREDENTYRALHTAYTECPMEMCAGWFNRGQYIIINLLLIFISYNER